MVILGLRITVKATNWNKIEPRMATWTKIDKDTMTFWLKIEPIENVTSKDKFTETFDIDWGPVHHTGSDADEVSWYKPDLWQTLMQAGSSTNSYVQAINGKFILYGTEKEGKQVALGCRKALLPLINESFFQVRLKTSIISTSTYMYFDFRDKTEYKRSWCYWYNYGKFEFNYDVIFNSASLIMAANKEFKWQISFYGKTVRFKCYANNILAVDGTFPDKETDFSNEQMIFCYISLGDSSVNPHRIEILDYLQASDPKYVWTKETPKSATWTNIAKTPTTWTKQ